MKTLNNIDFSRALKSLDINVEAGIVSIEDEQGTLCSYSRSSESGEANDTIFIFDDEFELTEKQKDTLDNILVSESQSYMIDMANAWCQADREHANSLIHS